MNDKATILYVDDEPFNLLLLKRLFKEEYHVLTASSGWEGLDILYSEKRIRAVISDMKMPGMNGIEFITKAKEAFPDTAFFILTGFDCTPEISDALKNNLISKYFSKPLNTRDILESLKKAID